ncbi:MAG TPA: hypothetical protein VGO00_01105 [Kofleriaceae bacterium]|nr:hypothetical protein [Kofleriaceae bacterium]
MLDWYVVAGIAGLTSILAARGAMRRKGQRDAAAATGLEPAPDLSHVSTALQRTALWNLSDGGFERRVVHDVVSRGPGGEGVYRSSAPSEIDVTAFDLETLRERRGEWAWLPVEPPFRIAGVVSVVICEVDRAFPHVLLKHSGPGDDLEDDDHIERFGHIAKNARDRLGLSRAYAAEMPGAFPDKPIDIELPAGWRAYSNAADYVRELMTNGLEAVLARADRGDLVIELREDIIVMYPAMLVVADAEGFKELTSLAILVTDGVLEASRSLSSRGLSAPA